MKVEQLRDVRIGAEIANAIPAIRTEIEALQKQIITSVMLLVNDNKLTPEVAQQKWMEYIGAARTLQRLEQKVRIGVSAGLTMPAEMK